LIKDRFIFNHIGIAVKDVNKSKKSYLDLSFSESPIGDIYDDIQNIKLSFLVNNGVTFELVQGLGENIVGELINKNGVIPYHTCYSVDDLNESVKLLTTKNFRQISKKIKAKAFNNSLIQFLYNPNAGIIELLEIEK
jgi:methylmalonyl-CoA/ethylmalonyl-CoA epimerase